MVVDETVQEEEKKKKEDEKKEQLNWFQRVPILYKIVGAAVVFVKYLAITSAHGSLKELVPWVVGVLIIWYIMGSHTQKLDTGVLTPEQAERCLKEEIKRKVKDGQIPRFSQIYIGPVNALFHDEGMPQHYQIGLEMVHDHTRHLMKAIVPAVGDTKGYVTLQENVGNFRGVDVLNKISALPPWYKNAKKSGIDPDKFLFGTGRQ